MTQPAPADLAERLRRHKLWAAGDKTSGERLVAPAAVLRGLDLGSLVAVPLVLSGADLSGADLSGAELDRTVLRGADLSGADLSRADLLKANLDGCRLQRANLRGARLKRADLAGADVGGADLVGANLVFADLGGTDLSGADLSGADVSYAVFSATRLTGARLTGLRNLAEARVHSIAVGPPEQPEELTGEDARAWLFRAADVPGPLRRANGRADPNESGADFVDGEGNLWDHKMAISGYGWEPGKFLDKVERNDLPNGEGIMLNHEELDETDFAALMAEIARRGLTDRFVFIPKVEIP